MAKKPKTDDKPKASNHVVDGAAAKAPPQKVESTSKKPDKIALTVALTAQFGEVRATLLTMNSGAKMQRQLRWAIKQLEIAERAAERAVTHAE